MESFIVKLKSNGKYFKVGFNIYNSMVSCEYVAEKELATIFQPKGQVINLPKGKLRLGSIRCAEFSLFLMYQKIKSEDIEVIEFDSEEKDVITSDQENELKEAGEQIEQIMSDAKKSRL